MPNKNKIRLNQIGEFGLIARLRGLIKNKRGVLKGIGDDAAVIASQGKDVILLTTDMLLEGVHFTRAMGAKNIGHKALACNLSDIAAMGGKPLAAVVSLGLPKNLPLSFVQEIYRGMNALAKKYGTGIVGGDTNAASKIIISVALLGTARKENIAYRSGAKKGDYIFVTGSLGRSLYTRKHLNFTPRLAESAYIMKHFKPTAMIDISDGLSADLGHILEESKAGAVIYEKLIPKTAGAKLHNALTDGEDFELLFTVPWPIGKKIIENKQHYPFYFIGEILDGREDCTLITQQGKRVSLRTQGFTHF